MALLVFFVAMMIALCVVFPFIAIPLLVIGVALYGFGKGFFINFLKSYQELSKQAHLNQQRKQQERLRQKQIACAIDNKEYEYKEL